MKKQCCLSKKSIDMCSTNFTNLSTNLYKNTMQTTRGATQGATFTENKKNFNRFRKS